jgi:hypothetical protein
MKHLCSVGHTAAVWIAAWGASASSRDLSAFGRLFCYAASVALVKLGYLALARTECGGEQ